MKSKTGAQQFFDELIKEVYHELKPLGFRKRALNFYRQAGVFRHCINIQKSVYGSANGITFTVNVGVDFSVDDGDIFDNIGAFRVRERIGRIVGDSDVWYEIDGEILDIFKRKQAMEQTKADFLTHVACVLDFLGRIDSEDKIKNYWDDRQAGLWSR